MGPNGGRVSGYGEEAIQLEESFPWLPFVVVCALISQGMIIACLMGAFHCCSSKLFPLLLPLGITFLIGGSLEVGRIIRSSSAHRSRSLLSGPVSHRRCRKHKVKGKIVLLTLSPRFEP